MTSSRAQSRTDRATSVAHADLAARVVLGACLAVVALWLLNGAPAAALRAETRAPLAETSDAGWVSLLRSGRWAVTWAVLGSSVVAGALAGRVGTLRRRLTRDAWATPGATADAGGVLLVERAPLGLHPGIGGALLSDGATERDVVTSLVELARRGHVSLEVDGASTTTPDVARLRTLAVRVATGEDEPSDLERGILTALTDRGGTLRPARDIEAWKDVVERGVIALDRAAISEGYYRLPRRAMVARMRLAGSLVLAGSLLIAALLAMNGLSVLWAAPVAVGAVVLARLGHVVPVLSLAGATTVRQLEAHRSYLVRASAEGLRDGRATSSLAWANAYAIAVPATEAGGGVGGNGTGGARRGQDWLALWPALLLTGTEAVQDRAVRPDSGSREQGRSGAGASGLGLLA